MFCVGTLIAILVLAAVGEVLEFVAGVLGAKRAGGSRRAPSGARRWAIRRGRRDVCHSHSDRGLVDRSVRRAFLGALGAELGYGRRMRESLQSGVGAGVGRLVGTGVKLAVGVAIWLIVGVAAFWP